MLDMSSDPSQDLRNFLNGDRFGTVMADPPWRFTNRTGKVAPEHKRLARYPTMTLYEVIEALHVANPRAFVGDSKQLRADASLMLPTTHPSSERVRTLVALEC